MKVFGALVLVFCLAVIHTSEAAKCFYLIVEQPKFSWFSALHRCRQNGWDLLHIDDETQLKQVSDTIIQKGYSSDWFWISGNDLSQEGEFSSVTTGHGLHFTKWSGGQPDNAGGNENCVHLWIQPGGFQMNDWVCTEKAYALCQKISEDAC